MSRTPAELKSVGVALAARAATAGLAGLNDDPQVLEDLIAILMDLGDDVDLGTVMFGTLQAVAMLSDVIEASLPGVVAANLQQLAAVHLTADP